ncbi:MAG: hypothetical protein QX199_16100 [Methylococcaceae bacterium]
MKRATLIVGLPVFFSLIILLFADCAIADNNEKKETSTAQNQAITLSTHSIVTLPQSQKIAPNEDLTIFPTNTVLPIQVKTGFRIDKIEKINEKDKLFSADVKLRLKWRDLRLRFNSWENGSNVKTFTNNEAKKKLEEIWQPEVKIANINTQTGSFSERGTGLRIYYNGEVELIQDFFGVFKIEFNLMAFPFDTQNFNVALVSPRYGIEKVVLLAEQEDIDFSGLSQEAKLKEWSFSPFEFVESQVRGWEGLLRSELIIQLAAKRNPSGDLNKIFMPLLLILFADYIIVICSGSENLERNVSVISSSLLAIIAIDFTVSINYPALESGSMIDKVFMVGYGYSWFLLLVAITLLNPVITRHIASRHTILEAISTLKWSIPLLLTVVLTHIFIGDT